MVLGGPATFLCLQTYRKPLQRLGIILSTYWLPSQDQFLHQTSGSLINGTPQPNSMAMCPVLALQAACTRECPCYLAPRTDGLSVLLFPCCPALHPSPPLPNVGQIFKALALQK